MQEMLEKQAQQDREELCRFRNQVMREADRRVRLLAVTNRALFVVCEDETIWTHSDQYGWRRFPVIPLEPPPTEG